MDVQKLYILVGRKQLGGPTEQSLVAAATKMGLAHELLIADDIMLDDVPAMTFEGQNLLYRVRVGDGASTIENALLTFHGDHLTGMYRPKVQIGIPKRYSETLEQLAAGLSVIPTSFVDSKWPDLTDDQLNAKVDRLGGYPVLYKTLGLAHGQGVFKLDTAEELRTAITDTLERRGQALLREYLPEYRHYRVIVVDGQAVASIEYHKPADDFRTNATDAPDVTAVDMTQLDPVILELAVQSVELSASLIGGVDILVDTIKQIPYLAEVNIPCNFSRAEEPTGVHIGLLIVQALLRQANAKS